MRVARPVAMSRFSHLQAGCSGDSQFIGANAISLLSFGADNTNASAQFKPRGRYIDRQQESNRGSEKVQNPGAFSIWSNQSKPISLTMRLEITISRASDVAWSLKCWWIVNGGT